MYYPVPDPEHQGDIEHEEYYLRNLGATVIDSDVEWSDDEISEATIIINVPEGLEEIFEEYGCYK